MIIPLLFSKPPRVLELPVLRKSSKVSRTRLKAPTLLRSSSFTRLAAHNPLTRLWALLLHIKSVRTLFNRKSAYPFFVVTASTPRSFMNEPMKLEIVRLASDGSNWVSYRDRLNITL